MGFDVIIQARTGSSRLPGKVLKSVGDCTLLDLVIRRLQPLKKYGRILVATSDDQADDQLNEFCFKQGYAVFRGSLNDVLARYYGCAKSFASENIIRVTSDCPFIDSGLIEQGIQRFQNDNLFYLSNVRPPTYPDGLDFSIFSFSLLEKANQQARLSSEREHVVPWIWEQIDQQKVQAGNMNHSEDESRWRWTVDYPEDLQFVQEVIQAAPNIFQANWLEILKVIKTNSHLKNFESAHIRDEGLALSRQGDQI